MSSSLNIQKNTKLPAPRPSNFHTHQHIRKQSPWYTRANSTMQQHLVHSHQQLAGEGKPCCHYLIAMSWDINLRLSSSINFLWKQKIRLNLEIKTLFTYSNSCRTNKTILQEVQKIKRAHTLYCLYVNVSYYISFNISLTFSNSKNKATITYTPPLSK